MKKFIEELKRRNVIKASLAYLVISWIIVQVAQAVLPTFGAPDWVLKALIIGLAIGLPIWIIISWIYEITPEGIEKTAKDSGSELVTQATNKRLNVFIIVSLSIAVIVLTLKVANVFTDSDKQYAIAVLPFEDMSNYPDDELFIYGIAQDIHTSLSNIKGIIVISDKSIKRYKDTDKTNPEIAKELGVDFLISGRVRKHDKEVRITAQLIGADDIQIWGNDYDRNLIDFFKTQRELTQEIVKQLEIELTPQEEKALEKSPTENMEAYQLFLKGREFVVQRGGGIGASKHKENIEKSIVYFQKAIALDSDYAEAYAELAQAYYLMGIQKNNDYEEAMNKTNLYLEKALKINPNTFRAYSIKAMIASNNGNWNKGAEYFEKAIAINANDASVHMQYGLNLRFQPNQDLENSLKHFKIAHQLELLSPQKINHLLYAFLLSGKVEEAEELFNKYGFLFSKGSQLVKQRNIKVYKNKNWKEAIRFYENKVDKDPYNSILYLQLANAYDNILNDDINFIKYAQKAYEIDSTNSNYATTYVKALTEGKKFTEAHKIMQSNNYKLECSKTQKLNSSFYYYYHQAYYKKAQDILKDSLMKERFGMQSITYAQLGDRKNLDNLMIKYLLTVSDKAFVYAILKERDSMYHYLGIMHDIYGIQRPNSRREFDPYRKEERYKALLRKHYLPLTHWNEE